MTDLTTLAFNAYRNSADHGFWDDAPTPLPGNAVPSEELAVYLGNKLMLIVGEVSEAHEELRKNLDGTHVYWREDGKPEGLGFELADIVIRVLDLAEALDIPIQSRIEEKMTYNAKRPPKHGKNF